MVLILWAMMIVVRPCMALLRASCTFFCESSSSAEVASSSNSTSGYLMMVLAMATLYFCPPESFEPLFPHWTSSKPFGSFISFNAASRLSISPKIATNLPLFYSWTSTLVRISSSSLYLSSPMSSTISVLYWVYAFTRACAESSMAFTSFFSMNSRQFDILETWRISEFVAFDLP